ncbi:MULTISPECIES: DUF456 domain-containing protein [Weeksella]|uniref:DUF456 domain-containing protein n=1 Tax=Weeksella virosa (strain ATCC 43766 / DSM 16922 / JCM 21250 / CCUG 30538 / CDC 9751 / IAM 14551 / NBRC 16016 / NCTC 11634 / CL345/78) TaxID=865938 RepID=F0NXL3_WEEVC|nr:MULTISPECIES: DUF456 domain-containing protein [Weeksella]ADX68003.1 protein of unknown function DUF456 [Weeksella virosa DSM 16922]MDK7375814.1 DUF456 domain-containing protein [Weeksella virosa]MDK7676182.1 DUF456 domain-containing protein [Weeksella virosa]OFM83796.1 hypothetical protein HMPREF2660_09715 [Weeksella sp. HMSC059D05]SUP54311.1 Protein of uncharacterised function (DUF456) [Weeksella virosa]
MDDSVLNIISGILLFVGLLGTVLPVLPGAPLALIGLLVFKFSADSTFGWGLLIVAGLFVLIGALLDYLLPIYMTKKMGGSRYGIYGSIVGLVAGLFFPPFGFLIGPFLGAFFGELLYNMQDQKRAFRAAVATFIGFLLTTGYDIILTLIFIAIYILDITNVYSF